MAKSALPLILAGGAALLLLGGKKKKGKPKLRRGCTSIKTIGALLQMDSGAAANYPMVLIVYPVGEESKAEERCREYGDGGWSAVMVSVQTVKAAAGDEIVPPGEYLAVDGHTDPAFVDWATVTSSS